MKGSSFGEMRTDKILVDLCVGIFVFFGVNVFARFRIIYLEGNKYVCKLSL